MSESAPEAPVDEETPAQGDQQTRTDWKAEARKWEQRAKENQAKVKELQPKATEYDQLAEARKTDLDKANEQVTHWQTEAERWRNSSVTSRIEALAAPDFAHPADAVDKLDPSRYLELDGSVNENAIRADLAALLTERPNWARQTDAPAPRPPAPNFAQGAGGNPATDPRQEFAALFQQHIR